MKDHPVAGGSYVRDPETGVLSQTDNPKPEAAPEGAPAPAPTKTKGGK